MILKERSREKENKNIKERERKGLVWLCFERKNKSFVEDGSRSSVKELSS